MWARAALAALGSLVVGGSVVGIEARASVHVEERLDVLGTRDHVLVDDATKEPERHLAARYLSGHLDRSPRRAHALDLWRFVAPCENARKGDRSRVRIVGFGRQFDERHERVTDLPNDGRRAAKILDHVLYDQPRLDMALVHVAAPHGRPLYDVLQGLRRHPDEKMRPLGAHQSIGGKSGGFGGAARNIIGLAQAAELQDRSYRQDSGEDGNGDRRERRGVTNESRPSLLPFVIAAYLLGGVGAALIFWLLGWWR